MSKLKVFAVYDSAVKAYMAPMFLQSKGQALRSWRDAVNDTTTQFSKHPSDFTLMELAEYDEETGRFENLTAPVSLGTALEHQPPKDPEIKNAVARARAATEKHSERNLTQ